MLERQVFIKEKRGHSFICTQMYIFGRFNHLCTIDLFSSVIKDGRQCISNNTLYVLIIQTINLIFMKHVPG